MPIPRVTMSPGGTAKGRSAGAFILALFGSLWLWLAAVNTGRGTAPYAAAIAAIACAVIAASFLLDRRAKTLSEAPRDPAVGRTFLWINVAQWVVGGAAVAFLVANGLADRAPAAIALVVGFHFFPLGWMFRAPVQYLTGAVMVGAALVFNRHYVPVLLISGAVLWLTAIWQLVSGFRIAQNPATARAL